MECERLAAVPLARSPTSPSSGTWIATGVEVAGNSQAVTANPWSGNGAVTLNATGTMQLTTTTGSAALDFSANGRYSSAAKRGRTPT
jgi:hypothetical protein